MRRRSPPAQPSLRDCARANLELPAINGGATFTPPRRGGETGTLGGPPYLAAVMLATFPVLLAAARNVPSRLVCTCAARAFLAFGAASLSLPSGAPLAARNYRWNLRT